MLRCDSLVGGGLSDEAHVFVVDDPLIPLKLRAKSLQKQDTATYIDHEDTSTANGDSLISHQRWLHQTRPTGSPASHTVIQTAVSSAPEASTARDEVAGG